MGFQFQTVSLVLMDVLERLMMKAELEQFILVGGTSLSLQLGHRMSTDIDLFTDTKYGSIDFDLIETMLKNEFAYVEASPIQMVSLGKHYFVGTSEREAIKLDLYYTEPFVYDPIEVKGIRLANIRDVAAMKFETIVNGGRKKDFWDVHELLEKFSLGEMFAFHEKRYPFGHKRNEIREAILDCSAADDDFDPVCLKSKFWELIKLDLIEAAENI
jgi:predicted nucleotidyltransferase component of viral defense system